MPGIASEIGATLKGKNREQIRSFKSSPYGKEAKYFMLKPLFFINIFLMHVTHVRNVPNELYAYENFK